MFHTVDDFTEPWRAEPAPTVLLIHGMAESHRAWFAWVPLLARHYRVLRIDLPGLGQSEVDLAGYEWTLETVSRDIADLLDELGLDRVLVVGAKIGGSTALQFAANHPERVEAVVDVGGPLWPRGNIGTNIVRTTELAPTIATMGVEAWARDTMRRRLGPDAPEEQLEWWVQLMCGSRQEVLVAATTAAGKLDLRDALPRIEAPALLLVGSVSGLAGDEAAEAWAAVPNGRREVVEATGYHISAVQPEACAQKVLDFFASL
jgi:3-oxoadipate enol-lactonase